MSLNCIASNRVPTARWLRRALMTTAMALASLPATSQNQLWIEQFGTNKGDNLWAAASDGTGGVYVGGDIHPGGPPSFVDTFLARYDSAGNQLWIRSLATVEGDHLYAIAPDGSGGVYVGGQTEEGVSTNSWDAWLARFDSAGTQLWIRKFGTVVTDKLNAAAPDGSGGVYVSGWTWGSLGGPNAGGVDALLARFDSAGNQLWIRQFGTVANDTLSAAAPDGSGGVYVSGSTLGNLGGPNAGGVDAWLARYDSSGSQVWIRQLGTSMGNWASAATSDGSGGVYVSGHTEGSLGGPSAGAVDAWLARYDGAGNKLWVRQLGTSKFDFTYAAASDESGGVYVCGGWNGSNWGGPTAVGNDAWLARYDSGGNLLWIRQIGTSSGDGASAAAPDGSGGVYMAGQTGGNLGGPNAGGVDAWLARYDGECGASPTYCTASSTSIPGCQAAIGAAGSPSLSSPSSYRISSGPVPGGSFGICFFGDNGPASTPFGTLGGQICVQGPFYRSAPKQSGGSVGACNGNYSFTLQDLINASPIVVQGAVIHAEIWARDTANPDGFLLSNGIELTVCP